MNLNDLIGKPYDFHGGMNCWDLCVEVGKRGGISLPQINLPDNDTTEQLSVVAEKTKALFKKLAGPEPLCIVAFYIKKPFVSHVGFVLEDGYRFIHSLQKRNVTIERLDHPFWVGRIAGFYKWIGD